jgi:hypothetical protein
VRLKVDENIGRNGVELLRRAAHASTLKRQPNALFHKLG